MATTLESVQDLLNEKLDLDKSKLSAEAALTELGVDSLAVVEFIFHVEDKFGVKVPDAQMDLKTVGDIAAMVDKLKAEQGIA
jgi:acyl carrier protein